MSKITRRRLLGSAAAVGAMQAWAWGASALTPGSLHLAGAGNTSGGGGGQSFVSAGLSTGSFTNGTGAGVTVASINIGLSPSSPPFTGAGGGITLTGANAADFQVVNSSGTWLLQTNSGAGTLPSNTTFSFNIVPTQTGVTGSGPFAVTISSVAPASNIVTLVNDDTVNATTAGVPTKTFGWVFAPGQIPDGHAPEFTVSGVPQPFSANPVDARSYHADGSLAFCVFALRPTFSVAASGSKPVTISDSGSTSWPAATRNTTDVFNQALCVFAPHCTVGGVSTYGQDPTTDWGAWLSAANVASCEFEGTISTSGVLSVSLVLVGTLAVGMGFTVSGNPENFIIMSGSGSTWQLNISPASAIGSFTATAGNLVMKRTWMVGDAGDYWGFTVNMSQTPGGLPHGLLTTDFYVHAMTYAPGGSGTPAFGGIRFWADIRQPYFDINSSPAGASAVKQMRVFAPPNPASPTSGLYWGENSNAHAPGNWPFPAAGSTFTSPITTNFSFPGSMAPETFTVQGFFTGGQFMVTNTPSNYIPLGVPLTGAGVPSNTVLTGYGSFNGSNGGSSGSPLYSFTNYSGTLGSSGSPLTLTGSYTTLTITSLPSGDQVNAGDFITGASVAGGTQAASVGGATVAGQTVWCLPGGQTISSETMNDSSPTPTWDSLPSYWQPQSMPMIPVGGSLPSGIPLGYFGVTWVKPNPFSNNGSQALNFGFSSLPTFETAQNATTTTGSGTMVAVPVVMPGQKLSIGDQWGEYQFFQGGGSAPATDVPLRSGIVSQQQWNNSTLLPPYDLSQTGQTVGGQVSPAFLWQENNQYNPWSWGELQGNLGAGGVGPYMAPWPNSCSNEFYNGDLTSYRDCIQMSLGTGQLTGADMAYSGFPTMPPMKMAAGTVGQASYTGMGPSVPQFYGNYNGGKGWDWPSPYVIPNDPSGWLGPIGLDDYSQHWPQPTLWGYIRSGRLELFDRVIQQATMGTNYNAYWGPTTLIPGRTYYNVVARGTGKIAVRYAASMLKSMACALWVAPKDPSGMWNPSGIDFAGSQMYQYFYDSIDSNLRYFNDTVDPTFTPTLYPSPPNDPNTANLVATDCFFTMPDTEDTFEFQGYISAPGSPGTPGTTLTITGIVSGGNFQATAAPGSGMVLLATGQVIGGAASGTSIVTGSHVWTSTYEVNISQAVGSLASPATFTWQPAICYGGSVVFEQGLYALGANLAYAVSGMPSAETFLQKLGTYYNSWTKRGGMYNAYCYGFVMGPLTPPSMDGTTGTSQAVWGSESDGWYYSGIDVWFEDNDNAFIQPNSSITPSPTAQAFSIIGAMDQQGIHTEMQNGDYVVWPSNYGIQFLGGFPTYMNIGVVYTVTDASGNFFNLKDPSGTYVQPTNNSPFQNNLNWRSASNYPLGAAAFGSDWNNYTGLVNCFIGWALAQGITNSDMTAVYADADTRIAAHGPKFGNLGQSDTYSMFAMNDSFT